MLCLPWTRALPGAVLLLLVARQLQQTHGWKGKSNDGPTPRDTYFLATVEYALHVFNLKSEDRNAYRLVRIRNSWKEEVTSTMAYSMKLELRRTRCGKFDDDIDNCPFQESPELNNTFTCFFTVSTEPWRTVFQLLNKTCLEGSTE
ncbi:cystatin-9-like [Saccopteryx bilineata]|uniref:cystatin-9-like n=1 Tax=Saccopteryx bilineata TaxID=59482 RepID=UPI00338E5A27